MQTTIGMVKMNGIGNEIIVIDMRECAMPLEKRAILALASAPETAFDQIMAIYPPRDQQADYFMEIWNRDGSPAGACGNGTRCVVDYLCQREKKKDFVLETVSGFVQATMLGNGEVCVDMGEPSFDWDKIPIARPLDDTLHVTFGSTPLQDAALVSMGNPHAIFFVDTDLFSIRLEDYGPILEHDPLFPLKANISIARAPSPQTLQLRTWERGAGLTRACGSAACAATVAAVKRSLTARKVNVSLPGGSLHIEWREADGHVLMQGPVAREFSGRLDPSTGAFERDGANVERQKN